METTNPTSPTSQAVDLDRAYVFALPGLQTPSPAEKAIYHSGVYAGLGFVGASILATGLLLLVTGDARPLSTALALLAGGGLLASLAWRRAWLILNRTEALAPAPEAGTPSRCS